LIRLAPLLLLLLMGLLTAVQATADPTPKDDRYNWVVFGSGVWLNVRTGHVRVPPGLPLDEVSRRFWNDMADLRGTPRPFPKERP